MKFFNHGDKIENWIYWFFDFFWPIKNNSPIQHQYINHNFNNFYGYPEKRWSCLKKFDMLAKKSLWICNEMWILWHIKMKNISRRRYPLSLFRKPLCSLLTISKFTEKKKQSRPKNSSSYITTANNSMFSKRKPNNEKE